ncbi:hypothetical protein Tco_1244113, partial [Tanacetum coccineum]
MATFIVGFISDLSAIKDNITLRNNKLQASVRIKLVNKFKHQLEEELPFQTLVEKFPDFKGSVHGFDFRPFNTITGLRVEEDGQFDVIGQVVACDDLDNYDKNGKAGKKKPLTLIDV